MDHESGDEAVEWGGGVGGGGAEGEEVLGGRVSWCVMDVWWVMGDGGGMGRREGGGGWGLFTSAVLGTLSQKTSIFMSPWVVCSVTDMMCGLCVSQLPLRRVRGR